MKISHLLYISLIIIAMTILGLFEVKDAKAKVLQTMEASK